jgi:hypothetical protein
LAVSLPSKQKFFGRKFRITFAATDLGGFFPPARPFLDRFSRGFRELVAPVGLRLPSQWACPYVASCVYCSLPTGTVGTKIGFDPRFLLRIFGVF